MNAVVYADGLAEGGRDGARARTGTVLALRLDRRARSRPSSASSWTPGSAPGAASWPATQLARRVGGSDCRSSSAPMRSIRSTSIRCATISRRWSISSGCARATSQSCSSRRPTSEPDAARFFAGDVLTVDHIMASACLPHLVPGGSDRRRILLGRRLRRQSAALAALLRDDSATTPSSCRSIRSSETRCRARRKRFPNRLNEITFNSPLHRRTARRRLRRPAHPLRRAEERGLPARAPAPHRRRRQARVLSTPRPSSTSPGHSCRSCATSAARTPRPGSTRISTRSESRARSTSIGRSGANRRRRRSRERPRRTEAAVQPEAARGRDLLVTAAGTGDSIKRAMSAATSAAKMLASSKRQSETTVQAEQRKNSPLQRIGQRRGLRPAKGGRSKVGKGTSIERSCAARPRSRSDRAPRSSRARLQELTGS